MKAMILAAGRGRRMGMLTEKLPKPLLTVAGKPLIERLIEQLVAARYTELVINIAWQGKKIRDYLGDGSRWGASITWSDEGPSPLGTALGIRRALPLLGEQPFLLINSDVVSDIDFAALSSLQIETAHLLLVNNPDHNPGGDFVLNGGRLVSADGEPLTYAGCGVFQPALVENSAEVNLGPIILAAVVQGKMITAQHHSGSWLDVGTPARLQQANQWFDAGTNGMPPYSD